MQQIPTTKCYCLTEVVETKSQCDDYFVYICFALLNIYYRSTDMLRGCVYVVLKDRLIRVYFKAAFVGAYLSLDFFLVKGVEEPRGLRFFPFLLYCVTFVCIVRRLGRTKGV